MEKSRVMPGTEKFSNRLKIDNQQIGNIMTEGLELSDKDFRAAIINMLR